MTCLPERARTAGDILQWCERYGILPLPCRPRSKGPHGCISTYAVYGNAPPGAAELVTRYGRRIFGASVKDSFHTPSPERIAAIRRFWSDPEIMQQGPPAVSISIDMNYPTADGYTVACIDVDDDTYADLLDHPLWHTAPLVRGRKGGKILFKLARGGADPPSIIQFTTRENLRRPGNAQDPPVIEIFTAQKHALIYGEHPESIPEAPCRYEVLRGFGEPVPVLRWDDVTAAVTEYAGIRGLVPRCGEAAFDPCQTILSGWNKRSVSPSPVKKLGQTTFESWEEG